MSHQKQLLNEGGRNGKATMIILEKTMIQKIQYKVEIHEKRGPHSDKDKEKERKHFSHGHPLDQHKVSEGADMVCKVCELKLVGPSYGCSKCGYFMHKTCYKLPGKIQHSAHRDHSLTLRSIPAGKSFKCYGCRDFGKGFNYHCSTGHYDLHVSCAGMPKELRPKTLSYSLNLYYTFPEEKEGKTVYCFVCDKSISKNGWVYCKKEKNKYSHLNCAFREKYRGENDLDNGILAIQDRLQHLQIK